MRRSFPESQADSIRPGISKEGLVNQNPKHSTVCIRAAPGQLDRWGLGDVRGGTKLEDQLDGRGGAKMSKDVMHKAMRLKPICIPFLPPTHHFHPMHKQHNHQRYSSAESRCGKLPNLSSAACWRGKGAGHTYRATNRLRTAWERRAHDWVWIVRATLATWLYGIRRYRNIKRRN